MMLSLFSLAASRVWCFDCFVASRLTSECVSFPAGNEPCSRTEYDPKGLVLLL